MLNESILGERESGKIVIPEILNIEAERYVKARGTKLSDYDLRGVNINGSAYTTASTKSIKNKFLDQIPLNTEVVIGYKVNISTLCNGSCVNFSASGVALVPSHKRVDGEDLDKKVEVLNTSAEDYLVSQDTISSKYDLKGVNITGSAYTPTPDTIIKQFLNGIPLNTEVVIGYKVNISTLCNGSCVNFSASGVALVPRPEI